VNGYIDGQAMAFFLGAVVLFALTATVLYRGRTARASRLLELGRRRYKLGRYAQAERLYRTALAILERVLGPDHAEFGMAGGGLAEL
jgi:hypothetical protein